MSSEDFELVEGQEGGYPLKTYRSESGLSDHELIAVRDSLEEFMERPFKQLESLIDMIGDDMYEHFGFAAESLIDMGKRRVQKACQLLTETVGEVSFDTPRRDEWCYDGTPFRVYVTAKKEEVDHERENEH